VQAEPVNDIYTTVLQYAVLPVLAFVILLCWVIANCLMSTRWRQARRNREIRRAVEALRARSAGPKTADEAASNKMEKPPL